MSKDILETIVRIDRAVHPIYPNWVKKVMRPELESAGPTEYDLGTIQLWFHNKQMNGDRATGQEIYGFLKGANLLEGCLGLADGLAIQQMGVAVFRKFFVGKVAFLWRSVVQGRFGRRYVPYLIERDDKVVVDWDWFVSVWDDDDPAVRFAS